MSIQKMAQKVIHFMKSYTKLLDAIVNASLDTIFLVVAFIP